MRVKLIIVAMLISSVAYAQQPQGPTDYNIKVTAQELDLIGKALGTMPFNDVAPLVQKLRNQVMEQQAPVKPSGGAPDPEKK